MKSYTFLTIHPVSPKFTCQMKGAKPGARRLGPNPVPLFCAARLENSFFEVRSLNRKSLRYHSATRYNSCVSPIQLKGSALASANQVVWLVVYIVVGSVGFGLLGYVNVWLADGKRFRDQPPLRKKIIACVSLAQWPYLYIAFHGAANLAYRFFP